jgi:hypothetical protein
VLSWECDLIFPGGGAEMDDHGTRPGRPRAPEPSWPTVIATTVRLWAERHDAARRRLLLARRLLVLAVVVAAAVAITATVTHRAPAAGSRRQAAADPTAAAALLAAAATRDQAAAWIASQVAADAIVACDPAMGARLQADGMPAARLLVLGPSAADPLGSDVVVATPAIRSQFGARLKTVYAPVVLASFGSGAGRIDVLATAADGAAAYQASLAADLRARVAAGRQLAVNRHVIVSSAARAALEAGEVDPRLLLTVAELAAGKPVRILVFNDSSPGASPAVPFRGAEITLSRGEPAAVLRSALAFFDAQRPPFVPLRAGIEANSVLLVEYAAPSPLGLLSGP